MPCDSPRRPQPRAPRRRQPATPTPVPRAAGAGAGAAPPPRAAQLQHVGARAPPPSGPRPLRAARTSRPDVLPRTPWPSAIASRASCAPPRTTRASSSRRPAVAAGGDRAALLAVRAALPARIALGLLLAARSSPRSTTVEIYLFKLVVDDVLVPRDLAALRAARRSPTSASRCSARSRRSATSTSPPGSASASCSTCAPASTRTSSRSVADALDRRRVGDLLARLTGDVQAIERSPARGIGEGIGAVARIVFFGGALFLLSWKLALAALVVAPLFFLARAPLRAAGQARRAREAPPQRLAHRRRRGVARTRAARADAQPPGRRGRALPARERGDHGRRAGRDADPRRCSPRSST